MDFQQRSIIMKRAVPAVSVNAVLKKTYILLSLTLLFSTFTATLSMMHNVQPTNPLLFVFGYFGLLFLTSALKESKWGLVAVFALTGFMGYTLGPILNLYITGFSNGSQIVATALGGTGIIFFALSGYALVSKKDFSYLGGFLFAGFIVAFLAGILTLFFQLPILSVLVSGAFALLSAALILFQTSIIINGGEQNYIMATVGLYVALFNLFISLLRILAVFSGNRN